MNNEIMSNETMNNEVMSDSNVLEVDPVEFSEMESDAEKAKHEVNDKGVNQLYCYTHKFDKPFVYMGKSYNELTFDWDSLTNQDGLDIEEDLALKGVPLTAPEFSTPYQLEMAVKACVEGLPSDAFLLMKLASFNRIKRQARSFLLIAG